MRPLHRVLIAVVLLGTGFFVVPLVRELFPSKEAWEAQLQADAETATAVLRPWAGDVVPEEFWERWDLQLEPYDEARRADLNARLHLYLDFLEAEYSEAADIYVSGNDPRQPSRAVRDLRERLPAAFGAAAEQMVEDADGLREDAFKMSPKHGGIDPDAPDFRQEAESLRQWLTIARPRVDRLTTPPGER
jgi:hypothetical protein